MGSRDAQFHAASTANAFHEHVRGCDECLMVLVRVISVVTRAAEEGQKEVWPSTAGLCTDGTKLLISVNQAYRELEATER